MNTPSINDHRHQPTHALTFALASILLLCRYNVSADVGQPVIGDLLYAEEFNAATFDASAWEAFDGNGCKINLCGFGNQELQTYSPNNVSIEDVPFEPGTRALALQARAERRGGNAFTSGKITSQGRMQVQYGMVELRISVPKVGVGLWPAAWMLGVSPQPWPSKGEIDIMEMGYSVASMASSRSTGADIDRYVGSNVIFQSSAACSSDNPLCVASTAWQTRNAYVAATSLADRFVTYRLYWTDQQIRFTVVDDGVERDMYQHPITITTPALRAPFYLLFNLAVGGNFTDARSKRKVTAPLPGTMYVDYVRIYQLNGLGAVVQVSSPGDSEAGNTGR